VVLVRSRIISGLRPDTTTAYGYSVVFGFSQQADRGGRQRREDLGGS
jgi:hypothetical protein